MPSRSFASSGCFPASGASLSISARMSITACCVADAEAGLLGLAVKDLQRLSARHGADQISSAAGLIAVDNGLVWPKRIR